MIKDDPAKTGEHLVMLSKRYSSIFKTYVPKSSFKIFMLVYLSFKINCTMLLTVFQQHSWRKTVQFLEHTSKHIFNWNRDHGLFKDYSIRLPVLTGQSFPVSLFSFVFLPYLPHEQQFLTQFEPRVHHGLLWMLRFQLLLWITSLLAIQNTAGKTKMLNSVVGQARIIYEDIIFLLFSEKVFTCIFYSVLFGHKNITM